MQNNVVQFPPPPEPPSDDENSGRIVFEIGVQRFAFDYTITDLDQEGPEVIPFRKKRRNKRRLAKGHSK
jgi:hypothetical protein